MPKSDFVFGSFDTGDYGGAFFKLQPINFPTPEKDTVSFEVPGRSGDLLIDYGSYKNVELTVEIGIDGEAGNSDFITLYDTLRAAVMVQRGYQRLEDSFYPDEYRQARAVKVERDQSDTLKGKAIITFDAKPQRYLTSGESVALTVEPTTVEELTTYGLAGDILKPQFISDFLINESEQFAVVDLSRLTGARVFKAYYTSAISYTMAYFVTAGSILIGGADYSSIQSLTYTRQIDGLTINDNDHTRDSVQVGFYAKGLIGFEVYDANGNQIAASATGTGTITPDDGVMDFTPLIDIAVPGAIESRVAVIGDAGIITLNTPATIDGLTITNVYIDCDTLNAYTIINNTLYNLNGYVTLDGEFLVSGSAPTVINIEGGIDSLSIIPRWWKL